MSAETVIRVDSVHKRFGHVHALQGVDLAVARGEIVAIIGDNGAGKSTLASVIAGALSPDAGYIEIAGERMSGATTRTVNGRGVETVYQTLALAPDVSIADNMFLGREHVHTGRLRRRLGLLDRPRMAEATADALAGVGWDGPPHTALVRELSGGQQQAVAVARAMVWAKLAILMDEPTAALAARQMQRTNGIIRSAAQRGLGVVVITHDIPNMLTYAHRIVVMRRGRIVAELSANQTSVSALVELMVGRDEAA